MAGKRDVHIDLKLDLHESQRQGMPESMLNLDQAALQVTDVSLYTPSLSGTVIDHPDKTDYQPPSQFQ